MGFLGTGDAGKEEFERERMEAQKKRLQEVMRPAYRVEEIPQKATMTNQMAKRLLPLTKTALPSGLQH